jgi:hypothetical protein
MNTSIILIIVVLGIYLAWKLMGTGNKKRHDQRRFSIRKHRKNRMGEDDDDDE